MNLAAPLTDASAPAGSTVAEAQRRRSSFAISVAAAFALNLLAIGAFVAAAARWHPPAAGSAQTSWITAVAIAPRVSSPAKFSTPGLTARPDATMPAAPEPAMPTTPKSALTPVMPPAPADSRSPIRFYRSSEVDRPAEPDSDWNLETATLDTAGIEWVVFDIFIDRDGAVVGSTIVEPATLAEEHRQLLEARLRETALRPALRGGAPVASVRRIEVSVLPGAP